MRFTVRVTAAIVFALSVLPAASGQMPDKDKERAENERDLDLRSWNLRILQLQHEKERRGRPRPQQALEQLQRDFSGLQIANKKMLRAALFDAQLDPKFISKSASEIRKRAERLNVNLALPDAEEKSRLSDADLNTQPLKSSVVKLGRLIFSFVDNPFFKEASVIDPQQTAKARRDLEDIIQLSEQIKKHSEQLSKTGH